MTENINIQPQQYIRPSMVPPQPIKQQPLQQYIRPSMGPPPPITQQPMAYQQYMQPQMQYMQPQMGPRRRGPQLRRSNQSIKQPDNNGTSFVSTCFTNFWCRNFAIITGIIIVVAITYLALDYFCEKNPSSPICGLFKLVKSILSGLSWIIDAIGTVWDWGKKLVT